MTDRVSKRISDERLAEIQAMVDERKRNAKLENEIARFKREQINGG